MSAAETTISPMNAAAVLEAHSELSGTAIKVRNLVKNYDGFEAVKGVDLDISAGEIFGIIGPDGAGKTSVFQVLGGVMEPTSGEAKMYGKSTVDARPFVGYLTQTFSLYQDLSVAENLQYVGQLRLLPRKLIEERGNHYLQMFDMARFKDRLAGSLSGGMKQKLALACALIAQPKILLLDEPTTGVDPVSRREFWDALAGLASDGMTMVVATPYLDEAERCHRVALMYDGVIRQTGTPAQIREQLGLQRLEVRAADLAQLGQAEDILLRLPSINDVQRFGDRLDLMVANVEEGEKTTREALAAAGIQATEFKSGAPTLENSFVAKLRELGGELKVAPFPQRREFRQRPAGAIAINAQSLSKRFGSFHAVKDINIEVKYGEIY